MPSSRDAIVDSTRRWIKQTHPDVRTAWITGSAALLGPDSPLPVSSDVDVFILSTEDRPKIGKFIYDGILFDVTWIHSSAIADSARLSSDAVMGFSVDSGIVVIDEDGLIAKLKQEIREQFHDAVWVRQRVRNVAKRIDSGLRGPVSRDSWPESVMSWLFPASLTTHLVLVAACQNPTVRKRYLNARDILLAVGQEGLYAELLSFIGADKLEDDVIRTWHQRMTALVDETIPLATSSTRSFASDVNADGRVAAVDGSLELIEGGRAREAVWWIVATFTRCLTIRHDAGERGGGHWREFEMLTENLAIPNPAALDLSREHILSRLPSLERDILDILLPGE